VLGLGISSRFDRFRLNWTVFIAITKKSGKKTMKSLVTKDGIEMKLSIIDRENSGINPKVTPKRTA
jgi:hypothetical protein